MDRNNLPPSRDKGENFEKLLKRWQQQTREEVKQKTEANYDFLNDPQGLRLKIKEESKGYIEEAWSLDSFQTKAKNIFKQFRVYYNPYNELLLDQPSFILKTRRVQYTFEKYRLMEDANQPT